MKEEEEKMEEKGGGGENNKNLVDGRIKRMRMGRKMRRTRSISCEAMKKKTAFDNRLTQQQ